MKKIIVYFHTPGEMSYPFNYKKYLEAFTDLRNLLKDRDAEMYIARGDDAYLGDSNFTNLSVISDNGSVESVDSIVKADLVFDKRDNYTSDIMGAAKLNNVEVDILCSDKNMTDEKFGYLMPKSILLESKSDFLQKIKNISTEKVVVKPVIGFSGEGIEIDNKDEIIKMVDSFEYPVLLQDFVDTSSGIPGITDTLHDLRIVMVNGEIVQSSFRTPKEGSLLANVAMGGSIDFIETDKLPKEAVLMAKNIDKELLSYGDRIFSVDMIFDGAKFWLLELNSRPGVNPLSVGSKGGVYLERLADVLAS